MGAEVFMNGRSKYEILHTIHRQTIDIAEVSEQNKIVTMSP